MSVTYWRRDGEEHERLARWMLERTAEASGYEQADIDRTWEHELGKSWWMLEAWETLVFIAANGPKKPVDDPSWELPNLCPTGEHEFRNDDKMGVVFCGKCDYWAPKAGDTDE